MQDSLVKEINHVIPCLFLGMDYVSCAYTRVVLCAQFGGHVIGIDVIYLQGHAGIILLKAGLYLSHTAGNGINDYLPALLVQCLLIQFI